MAATKNEISAWFDKGLNDPEKPTHMLIVCDTYDHEDFPIYVNPNENVNQVYKDNHGVNMQKVMEVYNLSQNKELQLNTVKSFNF